MLLNRSIVVVILVLFKHINYSNETNSNSKHVLKRHHHPNQQAASIANQQKHSNNFKTNIKKDDDDDDDDDDNIIDNENEIINTIAPAQPDPNIDNEFIEPHDVVHNAVVDFIVIKHRFSNTTNLAFPAYVNTRRNRKKGFNKDKFGTKTKISVKNNRRTATS